MTTIPNMADKLLPLVYEELRKLASARLVQERPDQTLTATALVHEPYLRLVGTHNDPGWQNKGHFFASAAEAMRQILLNRTRDRKRLKRVGIDSASTYRRFPSLWKLRQNNPPRRQPKNQSNANSDRMESGENR